MGNDKIEPIPWLGEGSVPPGSGVLPEPARPRGRVGLVAGSLALALGMGVGGVAVSQLSLGEQAGSGITTTQTGGDDAGAAQGTGTAAQPQPVTGEERDED
jgi:hypothetical protein